MARSEKLTVINSMIGLPSTEGGAYSRADDRRFGERGIANALRAELLEQSLRDGETPPVPADIHSQEERPARRPRVLRGWLRGWLPGG